MTGVRIYDPALSITYRHPGAIRIRTDADPWTAAPVVRMVTLPPVPSAAR